jgi:hypothetical protein
MRRLLVAALLFAGCKAQPLGTHDTDMAAAPFFEDMPPPPPPDLSMAKTDMFMCPRGVPEICNNGCDDDLNGYIDDDDPACTTQLLVTMQVGTQPSLSRLVLEPVPKLVVLDGNPVPGEAFAVHNHAFSPAAYVSLASSGTMEVSVRPLDGGVADNMIGYTPRDLCVFNGELLVVENHTFPGTPYAKLHRYPPGGPNATGSNEIMPPITDVKLPIFIDACASDGTLLYVSRHDNSTAAGQFVVIDKTRAVVGTIALPSGLPAGYNRCLDFAWTKKSGVFVGLFAHGNNIEDPMLNGTLMAPFAFDGGLGPAIDAGIWHGVGEFLP